MKRVQPTELGRGIVRFFEHYLPAQRGMSPHTIHSYRDALVLLLQFVAHDTPRRVEELQVTDLSAERVAKFLTFLETDRHNGIATRNARLGAIHAFARFLAAERPEHLGFLQRVLAVPFRRGARDAPIDYLESAEIDALLQSIDQSRPAGQRDYALFALMFNTGARVQELLNLRRRDLRLERPCQVRLQGKGNKVRLCPSRAQDLLDPRRGEHAPVADPHDVHEPKALLELGDLRRHGGRIGGVALEHLDRHRATVATAQQSEDDLRTVAAAIARVAVLGQRAVAAGDPCRGQVVEHQHPVCQMLAGQCGLDARLRLAEPVQSLVHSIKVDLAQS